MLYGLYASASGVMINSYKQDVLANNLANAETIGFKKDLTIFRQRLTAAQENPDKQSWTDPLMEGLGGGTFAEPTQVDVSAGSLERTGNKLDAAVQGTGFFTVDDHGKTRLTRNGAFMISGGNLVTTNGKQNVLGTDGNPIKLDGTLYGATNIGEDGTITQGDKVAGKIAVMDVADPGKLKNEGGTLFSISDNNDLSPSDSKIHGEFLEDANVDPSTELTALMGTQRLLEANANMIHYQDSTLDKLVNTVGKVS